MKNPAAGIESEAPGAALRYAKIDNALDQTRQAGF
jgi:hypothetical protein